MPRKSNKQKQNKPKEKVVEKIVYRDKPKLKKYYDGKPRVFETLGGTLGGYFGDTGSQVGKYLGKMVGKITGLGDYKISKNVLLHSNQVPFMHNTQNSVVIRNREYLTDIKGSINFNSINYNVNAGLKDVFPWLGNVAECFEAYQFEGLIFEFKATAGSAIASTNNALGSVIMSADYNALDNNYTSKNEALNSMFSVSTKPSENCVLAIECDPKVNNQPRYFVRDGVRSLGDLRLYDLCKIQIATQGMQADNINIGELWVSYQVRLFKPNIQMTKDNYKMAHYTLGSNNSGFFTNRTLKIDTYGLTFNADRVNLPDDVVGKKLYVNLIIYTTSGTFNYNNITYTLVGCNVYNAFDNGNIADLDIPGMGSGLAGQAQHLVVSVNAKGAYIQFGGGVALSKGEFILYEYTL